MSAASLPLVLYDFDADPQLPGYPTYSPFVLEVYRALTFAKLAFKHERIAGTVRRAGLDSLKVSYSPYWHATGAATCVVRSRNGMSIVEFDRAGAFSLSITRNPITIARRFADPDC